MYWYVTIQNCEEELTSLAYFVLILCRFFVKWLLIGKPQLHDSLLQIVRSAVEDLSWMKYFRKH
jgi:hypothetical protein